MRPDERWIDDSTIRVNYFRFSCPKFSSNFSLQILILNKRIQNTLL